MPPTPPPRASGRRPTLPTTVFASLRRATVPVAAGARARRWALTAGSVACVFAACGIAALAAGRIAGGSPPVAPAPHVDAPDPVSGGPAGETRIRRAFLDDFGQGTVRMHRDLHIQEAAGGRGARVDIQRVIDLQSDAETFAVYVPSTPLAFSVLAHAADDWRDFFKGVRGATVTRETEGGATRSFGGGTRFSGLIHVYTEDALLAEAEADLRRRFREKGVTALFKHPGAPLAGRDAPRR